MEVGDNVEEVIHLFFANDTMLFCESDWEYYSIPDMF